MYNQSAASYCMYNSTNASQVVCIIDNKNQTHTNIQYPYLPEYSMDISIFSYMYTLFLVFGCYSFLNPSSARNIAIKSLIILARYSITGYGLFKEYVYKPYVKYLHPNLLKLLNIDDGINEVLVIKDGKIIHSFKTMELFVKNNPIKFVKEFSDDSDSEQQEQEQEQQQQEQEEQQQQQQEQEQAQAQAEQENVISSEDLSDKVDYNKKCEQINELIETFKLHSLHDNSRSDQVVSQEEEPAEETDKNDEENNDIDDDYILDATEYDFIVRNFYYQNEKTGETHSYVFKYDIFYKSEMVEKYDVDMIKCKYISNRKFIGLSLKMNNQKYHINLTTPDNYYISDNSILNYSFLKWYMKKNYNVKLSHEYVISGIDNYVEMYKIHAGKKIIVHKNRFEVVDDESFINENSDTYNDEAVHSDSEIDAEIETSNKTSSTKNETSESIHLEENHEICDIEILDYD